MSIAKKNRPARPGRPQKNSNARAKKHPPLAEGDLFVAKAVASPEGEMRLIPRGADFSHALVSKKSGAPKLRNGFLALVKFDGFAKNGTKQAVPLAVVETIIGRAGEMEAEKRAIGYKYNLPGAFPDAVLKDAKEVCRTDPSKAADGRVDLRKKTVFTIDGDDAKDYDDAVGISKKGPGYTVWVCIADVSHYVTKGSALDREALRRSTSVYLDDRVIPMLPEALSNDLCSLVPREDRLTKTVEMEFSSGGELKDFHIYNSIIRSAARLTYSQVTDFLEGGAGAGVPQEAKQSLLLMKDLYEKIKKRSIENGELDFDLPEPHLVRDNTGRVTDVVNADRGVANTIIEQFMIAANRSVGMRLRKNSGSGVYRIHEPPTEESTSELVTDLGKFGYRADMPKKATARAIQKLLRDFKGKKQESAVKMLILRSLKRAVYSTRQEGHFGLGLSEYTHFTSPIRRYPDIIAHRMIDSPGKTPDRLDEICEKTSVLERNAERAERETIELETANYMKTLIGRVFTGKVISVLPFGMFLELNGICAEGFVPREMMARGGRRKWFDIGQEVKLRVAGADLERRRTIMEPV